MQNSETNLIMNEQVRDSILIPRSLIWINRVSVVILCTLLSVAYFVSYEKKQVIYGTILSFETDSSDRLAKLNMSLSNNFSHLEPTKLVEIIEKSILSGNSAQLSISGFSNKKYQIMLQKKDDQFKDIYLLPVIPTNLKVSDETLLPKLKINTEVSVQIAVERLKLYQWFLKKFTVR